MRLWSIHPAYLDTKGLVACWREGLLAQAVLRGKTKGYKRHPQLERFRGADFPDKAIAGYLIGLHRESLRRGYRFSFRSIYARPGKCNARIKVTRGQIAFELKHLLCKLKNRDMGRYRMLSSCKRVKVHPLFRVVPGKKERWEKEEALKGAFADGAK